MELKQYEIILVNLNPTMGSEIKKTKGLVIQKRRKATKVPRSAIKKRLNSKKKLSVKKAHRKSQMLNN